MKINLKKEKLKEVDNAFEILLENAHKNMEDYSEAAKHMIESAFQDCFGCEFNVSIVTPSNAESPRYFVMTVIPEYSTVEKIVKSLYENSNESTFKLLWEKTKKWFIEIDGRILSDTQMNLTSRELTAIALHEVGHIVTTNSIPARISNIMKYELALASMNNRALVNRKAFANILSFPILSACTADKKKTKDSIKDEIRADKFAKSMGYQNELLSVLTKFQKSPLYPKDSTIEEEMVKTAKFSNDTLEQFQKRQDNLMKHNLISLKESCASPIIKEYIESAYDELFTIPEDSMYTEEEHLNIMHKQADDMISQFYMTEFAGFGKKNLERITQNMIDYLGVKINAIQNEDDRMLLITYANAKLDLIEYYIQILNDPKLSKKYVVPHTMSQLKSWKETIEKYKTQIFNYKIPEKVTGFIIKYPEGYEG